MSVSNLVGDAGGANLGNGHSRQIRVRVLDGLHVVALGVHHESDGTGLSAAPAPSRVSDQVDVNDAVEYGVVDGVVHVAEDVVVLRNNEICS